MRSLRYLNGRTLSPFPAEAADIDHNCPVSSATERFGLVIDGGIILPFDDASNQMTREAVAKDGRKGNIEVSVVGARQGGLFKLESVQVVK
jgi:hypothetical protein